MQLFPPIRSSIFRSFYSSPESDLNSTVFTKPIQVTNLFRDEHAHVEVHLEVVALLPCQPVRLYENAFLQTAEVVPYT